MPQEQQQQQLSASTVAALEANKENPLSMASHQDLKRLPEQQSASGERSISEMVTGNTLPIAGGLGNLMSLSQSWLVAAALPAVFTRLNDRKVSSTVQPPQPTSSDKTDVKCSTHFAQFCQVPK